VAEARQRAEKLGVALDATPPVTAGPARRGHRPCWRPWTFAFIGSNGDVLACCNPRSVMGSLKKESFQEIWLGPAYERLRRRINSAEPPPLCLDCPDHNFRLPENARSYFSYPVGD
jgi:MoaA/NifB/PqqE/SkfB family radical SAM enzyme